MWKYLINGQEVSFSSDQDSERLSAIAAAESKNHSIELISRPKKEEVSEAPESAFSQVISGEVPKVEEDFIQDPAKSADAVSETVAQDNTVLPSEDTSLDSPIIDDDLVNKSVVIGDQSYDAATVVSSIRNGDIKLSGDISSEIYQWSNGENKGIKEGVTNETLLNAYIGKFPNARIEDGFGGGSLDEVVLSTDVTAGQEGQSIIQDIESYGESLEGTDWDEQKNLFENIFSVDPNITIEYDKKGVQQTQSKDRSKNAILTYTNPDTQEKSSVRINENTPGKETAKILSDFGDKYMSYNAATKITGQASAVINLAKPGGPLYVSDEAIKAELPGDVTTIFKPKEVSEFQGNRTGGVMVKKTVFPYKDELQAAREIIQKENPDISPEELFDQSTQMAYANIIASKRVELTKKKTEDLIESTRPNAVGSIRYLKAGVEEKTQSALLSGLFTKQSKISKESKVNSVVFCTELDTAEKTSNSVRIAQDYLKGKKINQTDIRLSDGSVLKLGVQDGSQMLVSKAGVKITKNQLSKIQSENALLNASSAVLDKLYERGTELGDQYEKLQPALEAAQLDYNLTEKYATSFGLGVADIATGLLYATNTLVKYSAPSVIPTASKAMDIAVDELAIKYKTATNDIRSSFVSDVAVGDAFSSIGSFAKFAMQEITTQAPVLLAMTASGGTLAPYVVGAWTAGQKGLDITYEDSITGKKTGGVEKTAKMIGYGLANGVFTSLTTNPILQRGIKTYKNAGFGKEFLLNSKDYITQNWKRAVVGDNVLELSGELATNVVENAIDGRPIFENADHVALSSLGFSFAFSTIPFIKGAAARYYSTSDTQLAMDRRMKQIVRLQQNWAMLDAKDPARKDIENTILELQAVNEATIDKLEKNISTKIDRQGSAGFQGVMNFINGAKQKASDIVNNPNLTPENKREMLTKLEVDFENHMNARRNFLDETTFGENFYLLEANDRNTYDRLINEAKINTGKENSKDKAVIDEAIKLYNTERIEENNAAAKKVDKNFQSFKTKDEAIEYIILELGDKVTPENSAAAEKNIMDGGAGVAIPLTDGTVVPIAIVESQLQEGKTSVSIHEVGHPIVSKIFKNNPEAMIVFADQIRLWLKQNSPSLDARMQLNINPYKQANRPEAEVAEETLMAFFEMIGDNKINLTSKENTTFASTLAYNMQEIAGNSYNFNFKGAEDFAAFAASIGNKIKNGDLSFSEIQRLSAAVPKVQKRKPTKKQEPKTKASMSIEALEEAYFDLQDQAAEDPNNLALYERMEKAGDALDAALAAPATEAMPTAEAVQEAPKEVIVRPKADKSKRKYSLDKEVKKEIEPKIAEAQKLNKELIAKEKKLNADAIAEIEAIDDKVESRTSREKRIADLKNKPLTVGKPADLNKIEREITAALETPINKAVNLFTKLYYDKIAKNATAAVTREEFMQSAKAEITSLTINEFKPETINRSGEEVINDIEDIIFQRGGLRLRNLAQRLGVISKEQGISRGADALTKIADTSTEMSSNTAIESITEQSLRKVSALLASETRTEQARQQVKEFWIENEGNTKVENFKKLPNLINNILSEMFGVTQGTLTARSGNLNKQDYANAVEAFTKQQAVFTIKEGDTTREARVLLDEVGAFQDGLNEQRTSNPDFSYKREANESIAEALFRFLPQTSAGDYKYASGRKGRFSGKSTGLPKNLMNLAYKVESRKTTGIGNVERIEQKLTMDEVLEAIGARKNEDGTIVKKSEVSGRDKEGQTLLGLINLFGRMTTNELSRTEGNLDPMTIMDLEMGKNPNMYSKALTKDFIIEGNNDLVDDLNNKINARFGPNWQDRKVASLADVVDFIYKDLKEISLNTARTFTYEYVEQLKKSDEVTANELAEVVSKAIGNAYGTAYKNILQNVGINKIWNSLSKDSLEKLSDDAKIKKIESFLKIYGRTFTNEKFLDMTTNADLFNELAKATGLGKKGLNKLGFTLYAKPGINPKTKKEQTNIFIELNKKPIKKITGTDYIKRQVATGNINKVNAAGITLEEDAATAQELILSEIDPLIKSGDKVGASEKLAVMKLGTNALIRKVSLLGKFIRLSPKDTNFILEHETAAVLIYDAYQQYINEGGTTSAKNKLENFLKEAYVNVISKKLDDALPRVGGVERMNTKEVKKLINKKGTFVIDYAAQREETANKNSLKLPKNLRVDGLSIDESIQRAESFDKAITLGNSLDQPTKGISVWDFDDTLATTKSNVLYTMPDGTTGKIDAAQFAKEGDAMLSSGAEFDFSEFSKVVKGEKGPFFEKAMARNKKFGNENVYILTARPANSAVAIHKFLKGIGLDIPLANITGLANSDPQAKANWVLDKFAEGYNDFYFADDHIGNVNAVKKVLDVLDVKSKVQQARVKSSLQLSKRFNEIIEEESGIEDFKTYQDVKAGKKGAKKSQFKFFIPPSAEDFLGLLYTTLPKGKKGESAMAFYKEHLLDPYGKAVTGLRTGRITIAKNYKALKKELGIVPRKLKKTFKYEDENGNMKESLFTKEEAIRVYTWDAQGFEIPGLSNVDLPILVNYVNANPDLKAFADKLLGLNKNTKPTAPKKGWDAGTITSDLLNTLNTDGRKQLLEVWQQNVDAIFSETNLNKLEAAYGKSYVRSLKDSLRRMKTGRNSTPTGNTVTDGLFKWINAAVGNIMFLNRRSAVLQLISFTNFINFEGNNIYQAGKAFANQKQYWKDWAMLMNSDYLVDRRDGLRINVNEADIATTAKENGFQGVLAKILQFGFIPTKMADTAAIATGGASFYRNKVNALIKDGMSKAAAEKQAMQDFVATAEVSQQSSDPSKISKQQAEPIGRIILAFANTPSQYARIIKRAAQDLKNGRGDAKTHLSRIVYYGLLQNLVFNFLQQAMFTAMMGDDDEEELTEKQEASQNKKMFKTANSMTDGILRGIGLGGAVVSTVKNLAIKLYERSQKTRNQNMAATALAEVMKLSPPISSKLSKVARASNSYEWEKKEMEFDKMSLKHPYVTIAANTVAAATGFPADRAVGMAIDAVDIASDETETWMKPLIALGWPKWQLMSEEDTKAEREEAKERFKGLEEDKEYDQLNPTEKRRKALKDLSKKDQVDMLWNAGVSRTEIKGLSKEAERIDKLMDIQNKEQFDKDMEAISRGEEIGEPVKIEKPKKEKKKYSPAMEKRRKVLKDLSKQEQVDSLWNRGLSKSEIRELTSEESRINKIIELQNKKRKNSLK